MRRAAALRALRRENGFTIFELLVAMPLMLIVLGGLTIMLTTLTHWSTHTQAETSLQGEARSAVSVLGNDLRGAFTGDGTNQITAATATTMTFTTPDEDPARVVSVPVANTLTSFHLLWVNYQVTGGVLQRQFKTSTNTYPAALTPGWAWGALGPWTTVAGQANSITNANVFTYYTQAGAEATPPTPLTFPIAAANLGSISAVGIKLTLTTGGSQAQTFTESDIVALRATDN